MEYSYYPGTHVPGIIYSLFKPLLEAAIVHSDKGTETHIVMKLENLKSKFIQTSDG